MDEHEGHVHGSLWDSYLEVMTDPGHLLAELTFTFIDLLILSPLFILLWKLFSRWFRHILAKEHAKLDAEHGVRHAVKEEVSQKQHCGTCTCAETADGSAQDIEK